MLLGILSFKEGLRRISREKGKTRSSKNMDPGVIHFWLPLGVKLCELCVSIPNTVMDTTWEWEEANPMNRVNAIRNWQGD
jgi:hypothetical protein